MPSKRQQQHSEELKNRILETAQQIIIDEGLEAVSIRRVTEDLGYSGPIIYHYFRDKNQLLSDAIREGYRKILSEIELPEPDLYPPDEELRISFKNFMESALKVPNAYRPFILNYTTDLLVEVSILKDDDESVKKTAKK